MWAIPIRWSAALKEAPSRFSLRMQSDRNKTVDEYVLLLRGCWRRKRWISGVEGGIISSVVPELRYVLGKAMERLTGKTFPGGEQPSGPGRHPDQDGHSRAGGPICWWMRRPPSPLSAPLVIFDMGTATTMSVLDREGQLHRRCESFPGCASRWTPSRAGRTASPSSIWRSRPSTSSAKHRGLHEGRAPFTQRRHAGRTGGPGGGKSWARR